VNKGTVCYRLPPLLTSVMSTTMVIVTTTTRVLSAVLPPIQWRHINSRLFTTDLPLHRRRLYPSALRRIITLMCLGERFLHGGMMCVSSVSYLLALCNMTSARLRASLLLSPNARRMLYRATA